MLAPFRFRGVTPYVIGLFGVIVATLLRSLFDPYLGEHLSFSFDYLAVFVAAWTGGFWPAVDCDSKLPREQFLLHRPVSVARGQ